MRFAGWVRGWLWVVLLVAGCDAGPGPDAGRDAGRPDAGRDAFDPSCHFDCFGYYACEGGVILRYANTPVPCEHWMGRCPSYPDPSATCLEGCREGARGPTAEMVCNENQPHAVGDPCASDADCQPTGSEPDGFGGYRPIVLTCGMGGTCQRVFPELCNAVDDDGDGSIDEDCLARPRRIGSGAIPGPGARFVLGRERIGVISGYVGESRLTLFDESGAVVGTIDAGLASFQDLTTDGRDLVVLLHAPYASSAELLVIGSDAAIARRVTLRDVIAERYVRVLRFGAEWLVYDGGSVSRHRADGARIDTAPLTTWPNLESAPIDGGLLLVASYEGVFEPLRLRTPLAILLPPYMPEELRMGSRLIALEGAILGVGSNDYAGTRLVRYDAVTGLELERLGIGHLPALAPLPLTHAGDAAALSWRDGDVLRTQLFDAGGVEVGRTELDLAGVEGVHLVAGEMAGGARIIAIGDTTFTVLAPAER